MPVTRQEIMDYARTFIGVRWRHQGRDKAFGIDCVGLISRTGNDKGLITFDIRDYDMNPDGVLLQAMANKVLILLKPHTFTFGDVLMFKDVKLPCHMAIVGDKGHPAQGYPFSLIHAYRDVRKCTENLLDESWMKKIVAQYSFPGVTS